MSRRRGGRAPRSLLAIALLLGTAARAQPLAPEPAAAPPAAAPGTDVGPPAPPPLGPVAIPVGEVASRVDPTRQQIAAMLDVAEPDPVVAEIEQELLATEEPFRERVRKAAADLQGELSIEEVDDLEARAEFAARRLDGWQKALSARAQVLAQNRDAVKALRETWSLTWKGAKKETAPDELLDSIKQLRDELGDAEKLLDDRFDDLLKLQGLVAEQSLAVSVLSQDIRRARYEVRGRLLERNRKPIHEVIASLDAFEPLLTRLGQGMERDARNVQAFATVGGGRRIGLHALLFCAFLLMAVRMRYWIAARKREGKSLGQSAAVFDHPVSTALVLGVLATPWIHPYAPRAYMSFLGVITIIPVVVLLPRMLAQQHRSVWYALAAVFVLDRIRYLLQPVELVERTLLLVTTGIGAALAIHLLRRERFADLVAPRFRPAFRAGLRFAVAALAVSVVANVVGFVALADLLGMAVLRSAWGGTLIYAAVSIARPVLGALLRSRAARSSQMIQRRRAAIERSVGWAIGAGAALWWAARTLDGFALADPLFDALTRLVTTPVEIGNASISLGDVLLFLATAGAGIVVARLVTAVLEDDVFPRARLARGIPHAISATVRYLILVAGFLLAAAAAGFEWNRVTLLAGAFGVGIGFGLQNIVNNFMSGLILLYERPIQVGDTVEVKNLIGEVKRIGIRSSSVRTWQGAEVIVPNASLISEQVVNWTLSDRSRRIDLPVTVANSVDPARVLAQLEEIGRAHPGVMAEPEPTAVFHGFAGSGLAFELRVWTTQFERYVRIRTELALAVHAALHGVLVGMPVPPPDATLDKSGA